eukprot:30527_1
MEERYVQHGRKKYFCFKLSIIPALILTAIDYSHWKYNTNTVCNIIDVEYHSNPCKHHTTFISDCNGKIYKQIDECTNILNVENSVFATNSKYNCWTNSNCSTQPIFYNYLNNWPCNMFLIPGIILFILSFIKLIELLHFIINLYHQSSQLFWKVICMIFYQKIKTALNTKINTEYFINGYFRQLQIETNLQNIIIPFDIIQLCVHFYAINIDEFNKHTVAIAFPMRIPIQSVAQREIFCKSSVQTAISERYKDKKAIATCIILYIAVFISEQFGILSGFHFLIRLIIAMYGFCWIFSFWTHFRRSQYQYYWKDFWHNGLYFDVTTKWIKKITFCAHYGKYKDNIDEPIIYTKNKANICEFKDLKEIYYNSNEYSYVEIKFVNEYQHLNSYSHMVNSHDEYQKIVNKIKQIMHTIDPLWLNRVNIS